MAKTTIKNFIVLLDEMCKIIQDDPNINTESSNTDSVADYCYIFPILEAAVAEVKEMAERLFIMESGQHDEHRHSLLMEISAGKYYVTCGEKDSQGWINGRIITPKGEVVYGNSETNQPII